MLVTKLLVLNYKITAATKLSDTLKEPLKTLKEGLNNTAKQRRHRIGLI